MNAVAMELAYPFQSFVGKSFIEELINMQSPEWCCSILLEYDGWLKVNQLVVPHIYLVRRSR